MFTVGERLVYYTVSNWMLKNRVPYVDGLIVGRKRLDKSHVGLAIEFKTKREEDIADRLLGVDRNPKSKERLDTLEDYEH